MRFLTWVRLIKGAFAREQNLRKGTAGSVWQPSFDRRLIRSSARPAAIIDYIDGNPVKAGFVDDIAAYAFGSGCGRYPTDLEAYVGDRRQVESLASVGARGPDRRQGEALASGVVGSDRRQG